RESSRVAEPIIAKLTRAPGNNAPIGGLKVVAAGGWFAARPSGTENIYKVYAESFQGPSHLNAILSEAEGIVNNALNMTEGRARGATLAVCHRVLRNTALLACSCTSRRCRRLMVLAM